MTAKRIARRTLNRIQITTLASRIEEAQSSGMWAPRQMIPDWFGLHGCQSEMLNRCSWWLMQSKQGGIREWSTSRTEWVNVSPASLSILTESCSSRYILGKWWAVGYKYRLIKHCKADAMNVLTRFMNFCCMRANSAWMLLRSALPQGQVWICDKDYQDIQRMMKTSIGGSRCWMDNQYKWGSMEPQRFVVV